MATDTKQFDRTKANKARYKAKVEKRLAKKKQWRMVGPLFGMPLHDLTRHTLNLFVKWGHRKDECKTLLRAKRYYEPKKKVVV